MSKTLEIWVQKSNFVHEIKKLYPDIDFEDFENKLHTLVGDLIKTLENHEPTT